MAQSEYLFDNVQFIWSVVKQGVEGVTLWKKTHSIVKKKTTICVNIHEENSVTYASLHRQHTMSARESPERGHRYCKTC